MDSETKSKLDDLEKRMKFQEDIHQDVTANPTMFIHGVVNNRVVIILTSAVLALSAALIINRYKRGK